MRNMLIAMVLVLVVLVPACIFSENTHYNKRSGSVETTYAGSVMEKTSVRLEMTDKIDVMGGSTSHTYIQVLIHRSTIGAADTEYFTVAIFKDSKLVHKRIGEPGVASVPGIDKLWWNIMIVSPPLALSPPYEVVVLDTLMNKRHRFMVNGYGSATPIAPTSK